MKKAIRSTQRLILLLFVISISSCLTNKETTQTNSLESKIQSLTISPNEEHIVYQGRVLHNSNPNVTEVYWPGSSISLSFIGISAKAILDDENGTNYYNLIIDGAFVKKIHLQKGKKEYTLAINLEYKKHTIELHKRNDWTYGKTVFHGFRVMGEKTLPAVKKDFFIEFYGNSITVGYGNEDFSGDDSSSGNVSNNYYSYAARTARNLNAEYSCIALSGIGLKVSWFNRIMPEMYDALNPKDSITRWKFNEKQPDVVVINLLQNDSWIVDKPNNVEFIRRFGKKAPSEQDYIDSYVDFINELKGHYPQTKIVCYMGNMDITKPGSIWLNRVAKVVAKFPKDVYMTTAPYIDTDGLGHPKVEDHKVSADILTSFIKKEVLK
ncbi:SGNH/GDSL hydrolase family protein [Maribacter sp.]|uniref:SGNH/GDSL hydrolase family protein n=1 Tax=Maribacter sp. TaxID=1897614 RepID=UPI0025C6065A|nr:SGNH/GDSL hydrolase family protein [Maribacter sp.]